MRVGRLTVGLFAGALLAAAGAPRRTRLTSGNRCTGTPSDGRRARWTPDSFKAFTLDRSALQSTPGRRAEGHVAPRPARPCSRCPRPTARCSASPSTRPRSWSRGWRPSTRRSRPTRARASTTRRPRSSPTRARWASTRRCGRARARSTSTRTTRATTSVLRVLLHARREQRRGALVRRVRRGRREQGRRRHGRRRARPGGPAAHLPARADHRPELRDLLRGRQRHRGQGHADEPREPDLQHRVRDQARPDRRHRQAQPQHGRAGHGRERPVRLGALLHGHELLQRGAQPQPVRDRPDHRRRQVRHRPHRDGQLGRRRRRPGRRRRRQQGDAAAPAWPRRSATSSPSTTWPTRWAISSTATTPSTARWPTAAATAAAPTRSNRAPAPP